MKVLSTFADLVDSKEAVVALGVLSAASACVFVSALLFMSLSPHF
ncbi:hypothetical membrane protein [Pseudomonas knackmussii B13]|uniref:Hypothetical membrane protein n=1 Tax=Pseudomonas knackmussii (strain DSM 6978 / CCUG 54928 / LMG 23759 / B13) TaxID=1301098 RepID=A0A024HIS6_PSEKB|nr:hypothetical protein [Pseudomonas knackmussii]CDF84524.1 hypothetical membrane protein [Pseudomonas knackmussii B13]